MKIPSAPTVSQLNLLPPGGLWGKRSHPEPIASPRHHRKSFDYIRDHQQRGAAVVIPQAGGAEDSMESLDLEGLLID